MQSLASGPLRKLLSELHNPVSYRMPVGEQELPLNTLLGKQLRLQFLGEINCMHCGRKTKKSFNQGYCYPCFSKLARCDICIISPEKCHYHQGTCREPEWSQQFCMATHTVYLANSSGIKVGITRNSQIPTRWIDQGAVQALPILRVKDRQMSGLVEVLFKEFVADKTNWRAMLKGQVEEIDLLARRDELLVKVADGLQSLQQQFGLQSLQIIDDAEQLSIDYPVVEYPTKVSSLNFDKNPLVEGTLMGIKGQYLILDIGVINIRKFGAYVVEFSTQ